MLASTIMIGMDVATSDLDVVCEVHDFAAFEKTVRAEFGSLPEFDFRRHPAGALPAVVANFCHGGFRFELFGQPVPVLQQNACRHLRICYRLLTLAGEPARNQILQFRRAGLKMEPAFAQYFKLAGDPYAALLSLETLDDRALEAWLAAQH